MKSKIKLVFDRCKKEKRPALITYTVASDPNKKKSLEILKSISGSVDICEIGFPHSTPIGDGGQIQTSSYRAIKNGFKMKDVFYIVKNYKKIEKPNPVILMGYYNMIFQFGENKFLKKCRSTGVDGIICVDLPWPENKNFAKKCKKKLINFIQLLSPTTTQNRMRKIIKASHDMIYYISMLSTTGGKLKVSSSKILEKYDNIKKINKSKNVVIGFGITTKTIKSLRKADGLVVGSELCKGISDSLKKRQNPVTKLNKMVSKLKKEIK
ncbi:tryptophan synthase subunit alpha [Pelagibacteraceae bacterium]|nr:tryptophan synthase subunit alpha [Pelagibacteraceae bacterium]